jgi:hypothetical protein
MTNNIKYGEENKENLNSIQINKVEKQEINQDIEVKQILLFSESDEENEELIENERHNLCHGEQCIEIICYCACGLILLFIYLVT